jgi:hypothetical protein
VQVKKHHDKLQAEKEAAGIAKLHSAMPKLSRAVLAYALQDCAVDADKALLVLRQFQSEAFEKLADVQRKRRKLRAKLERGSSPESSQTSGSSHEHRDKRSKRKSKSKHKHKSKSGKHKTENDSTRSKEKKDRHKKRRKRARSREHSPSTEDRPLEFGSFGILRESDYHAKRPEFAAWASEVKHIDIEALSRCGVQARARANSHAATARATQALVPC